MDYFWAIIFSLLLFASLGLHIFSLPANWVLLVLAAIWSWLHPEGEISWLIVGVLATIAVTGEIIEFVVQGWGARKFGASGKGNWGGIVGAILGAILGAPILFGIGAIFGALLGAFFGCLLVEMATGKNFSEARHASWGAFWGKAFGLTIKTALGLAMVFIILPRIWPS